MEDWLVFTLIMVGAALFFLALFIFVPKALIRHAMKKIQKMNQPKPPPEGYTIAEENAYIIQASQTAMMINQYPVMQVQIAIFPQNGPMLFVNTTRSFTYAEIPYLRANEPVRISYEYNSNMARQDTISSHLIQNIKIIGPAQVQWEGDARAKDAVNLLVSRIENSKLIDTQGTILEIEKTNALLGGNPVFRYRVRFQAQDGQWIEGDTYQAARPWLEEQRYNGCTENVQYSATNYNDFIFEKR